MQWLGQAAFKITKLAGKVMVIDPWLNTNPETPEAYRKLEALGKVDRVLVMHGHFGDMADAPALANLHEAPLWAAAGWRSPELLDSGVGALIRAGREAYSSTPTQSSETLQPSAPSSSP